MAIIETKEMAKREAGLHWAYTGEVIARALAISAIRESADAEEFLRLCEYLYVQAFRHGWKHAEEAMDAEG